MSSKHTREEIAKQFTLPERQSKIESLLKPMEVYCICRSSDSTRFMIACDGCEEWYHGDCVNVSQSEANNIHHYYCQWCIEKDPSLEIEYKKKSSGHGKKKEVKKPEVRAGAGRRKTSSEKPKELQKQKRARPEKKSDRKERKTESSDRRKTQEGVPIREHRSKSSVRRCFRYPCKHLARQDSKYCSDKCGVELAAARIIKVLPTRLDQWNLTPTIASEKNKQELVDIRRKQEDCKKAIAELGLKRDGLDAHIEYIQAQEVDPNVDFEDVEEEGSIYCVICGQEVPIKTCIKHMERCYNKHEIQTSFGSAFKTDLEGAPLFCDVFNPQYGTYCKRLKVICPEHSKEPKINDSAICGYPLSQMFEGPTENICKLPKKKCNRHFSWEKIRRGEIDQEKVRYWLKLDELLIKERQIKQALTERPNVLGLLLHSTFDHELTDKIKKEEAERLEKENMKRNAGFKENHMNIVSETNNKKSESMNED